jgi:hypothetical protein
MVYKCTFLHLSIYPSICLLGTSGKGPEECSKCPIGKYIDVEGSVDVADCKRCPAGKNAEEAGMPACKCITKDSCDMEVNGITYFNSVQNPRGEIDYYREGVPYIGRF